MGQGDSKRAPLSRFINNAEDVSAEALHGLLMTSPVAITTLDSFPRSKVLLLSEWKKERVAVLFCGGTGHGPGDVELIGEGLCTAVAAGRVWREPTVDDIVQAIAAVSGEAGCIIVAKNSFGARLNANLAVEQAEAKLKLRVRVAYVSDDVVSIMDTVDRGNARGIAGVVLVCKVAGAAAAAGLSLDEVHREAMAAADGIASIGVAYSRGSAYIEAWTSGSSPVIPTGSMEVGVGVHGEPGWMRVPSTATAKDIVDLMITRLVPFLPEEGPLCVMLNNLGSVPRIEMCILAKQVMECAIAGRVGLFAGPAPYYTALNTNGFSLSVVPLRGRIEEWLMAYTECRGWIRPVVPRRFAEIERVKCLAIPNDEFEIPVPSEHPEVRRLLREVCQALLDAQDEIGSLSAKTGTGKLGLSLARYAKELLASLEKGELPMACPRQLFAVLSKQCDSDSGVLFSFAKLIFAAAARELKDINVWDLAAVVRALNNGAKEAQKRSNVGLNRRTFLDALVPALEIDCQREGANETDDDDPHCEWWRELAAAESRRGARATAHMIHASDWAAYTPLAQRAGFADAGAVAVATVFTALATPIEGLFRKLPDGTSLSRSYDESDILLEEAAKQDLTKYYEVQDKLLGEGAFRRVRLGKTLQGPRAGTLIAISEKRVEDLEERGVCDFRRCLVMDQRRMLNWLFKPKPHIVQVHEVILTPGSYYYVMEYLEGKSLMELLESGERLSYERVITYLQHILLAVRGLHRARLIHRDIKPDNLRCDAAGVLKLCDVCGMVCHLADSYTNEFGPNRVCGTLAYMSPEALDGSGRQAADMWAVGVILHLMLTGRLPFEVSSIEEAEAAHDEPFDLSNAKMPQYAKRVVLGLLERNARNRLTVEQALDDPWVSGNVCPIPFWSGVAEPSSCGETYQTSRLSGMQTVNFCRGRSPSAFIGQVTKTLYLIRHGEAMHNIQEKIAVKEARKKAAAQGLKPGSAEFRECVEAGRRSVLDNPDFYDASLSTDGRLEALRCKCEIEGLHDRGLPAPTVVLSSPLQRALQTAHAIFPYHASVHAREDLRERRTGLPCDSRTPSGALSARRPFQTIDFREAGNDNETGPDGRECILKEEKAADLRVRAGQFLKELPLIEARDESQHSMEHDAICIVTHKGFLRELERGPLGYPEAAEFANCEVRVYEVKWSCDGELQNKAKCIYSNTSLCTVKMSNFPSEWLDVEKIADLPGKIHDLLVEFGHLRESPVVEDAPDGLVATVVFEDQREAAAAARKLHGLDSRTEEERIARPTAHLKDRFKVRVLYDIEQEKWFEGSGQAEDLSHAASASGG